MEKSLKEYAEIAHNILNNDSRYKSNKTIISSLFIRLIKKGDIETIKNRLTIIDSYYSTQMNKRLYGIEELAEIFSLYSDDRLKNETSIFLEDPQADTMISSILNKKYGINKEGKPFGKAISLISKYLYFLNDYNFPIFDNLAFDSYAILKRNMYQSINTLNAENYFTSINHLNNISEINNYEKLDNILWLLGKLKNGSFSILMDMDKYKSITSIKEISQNFDLINNSNSRNKSTLKDNAIRTYIANNYKKSILFNNNEKAIFEFAFSLI